MVMKLALPAKCSIELVSEIVAERQNGVNAGYFLDLANEWEERVQAFVDAGGNPETIGAWEEIMQHDTRFLTLYNSPADNSVQKAVFDALRKERGHICPACGEDGVPHTLDHYLPKSRYPHFAAIPANLFPMCDICQGLKLAKTLNGDHQRLFIHPYFDDFLRARVLQLTVGEPYDAPRSFLIAPIGELDEELAELLERHIKELQIQPRFAHFIKDMHSQLVRTVANIRAMGMPVIPQIEFFRLMEAGRGLNGWRHIFYASILEDAALLEWLQNGDLPDHVNTIPEV